MSGPGRLPSRMVALNTCIKIVRRFLKNIPIAERWRYAGMPD